MLDTQINMYSVDTGHFYSNHEKYLHDMNCKYRQERNYLNNRLEDIKKEKVFEENQQHLKDKYNMTGEAVVIVEKNNLLKYLIKYGVALIRLVVTIAILVLATLGVLTIVYPNSRHELLFVLEDIYSQMCVYLPFLSSLR